MKNYLFDLYGTLADVRTDENSIEFKEKYAKYFAKINPDIDFWRCYKAECERLMQPAEYFEIDVFLAFKALMPAADDGRVREAAYAFRELSRSRLRLYDGVKNTLEQLKRRGAKIFLVSNAQSCFTLPELGKLKIYNLFDGVYLSSDFGSKKPCKAFFKHVLDRHGLKAEETVYCGNDIKSDVLGAKSVNLATAYVKTAISPADDDIIAAKRISDFATCDYKEFLAHLLEVCENAGGGNE